MTLPVGVQLDRLERRLAVLTEGLHDLPPWQKAIRATIARSFDLLADEQRVLRSLVLVSSRSR